VTAKTDPVYHATVGRRHNGDRWLTRNWLNLLTIAFLAGNVFVFLTIGQRLDDHVTAAAATAAEDDRRHCLLAYAIDFPDSNCDWFFDWLDRHPEVQNRIRGTYPGGTNGRDTLP
jgi:hypothetical protein